MKSERRGIILLLIDALLRKKPSKAYVEDVDMSNALVTLFDNINFNSKRGAYVMSINEKRNTSFNVNTLDMLKNVTTNVVYFAPWSEHVIVGYEQISVGKYNLDTEDVKKAKTKKTSKNIEDDIVKRYLAYKHAVSKKDLMRILDSFDDKVVSSDFNIVDDESDVILSKHRDNLNDEYVTIGNSPGPLIRGVSSPLYIGLTSPINTGYPISPTRLNPASPIFPSSPIGLNPVSPLSPIFPVSPVLVPKINPVNYKSNIPLSPAIPIEPVTTIYPVAQSMTIPKQYFGAPKVHTPLNSISLSTVIPEQVLSDAIYNNIGTLISQTANAAASSRSRLSLI